MHNTFIESERENPVIDSESNHRWGPLADGDHHVRPYLLSYAPSIVNPTREYSSPIARRSSGAVVDAQRKRLVLYVSNYGSKLVEL
jgi:hypothetical protein